MRPVAGLVPLACVVWLGPVFATEPVISSPADAIREAKVAGEAKDRSRVERILRAAHERWPDDLPVQSYLGAVLFSTGRMDESHPLLDRVCRGGGHEGACAVSVGIDLVRNRWERAFATASGFSETSCQRSDRLWTMKLLASSSLRAKEVAERLVQAAPGDETSYLFLAAAQWQQGDFGSASATIKLGKARSTKVILLNEPIGWARGKGSAQSLR